MPNAIIVEDDESLADIYQRYFISLGWGAQVITDGAKAYDQLQEAIFDHRFSSTVILDLHMPGRSGEDIYRMLQVNEFSGQVIICTADKDLAKKYIAKGATTLVKPVSLHKIGELLKQDKE